MQTQYLVEWTRKDGSRFSQVFTNRVEAENMQHSALMQCRYDVRLTVQHYSNTPRIVRVPGNA